MQEVSMNAMELFLADGKYAGVWYCGKCRKVKATQEDAEACCEPKLCRTCEQPIPEERAKAGWSWCEPCEDERRAGRNAKRMAAAEKLPLASYEGMVWWDCSHNDGYFQSIDDFMDWWQGEEPASDGTSVPLPPFVWACKPKPIIDGERVADRAIESILEDAWEDAEERDLKGAKEFRAACQAFADANPNALSWDVDYKRMVATT